ncbi:hypothetical protein SERLA73DRAFT_81095 [Serpula lacrymans var. lacrymans S7.3]|uniref:Uncharacterized protein n=1 Tax=Serpula lacrymans var. lacrymans (strain S7.3) TaxID=936435 RepID=F8QKQ1_SERL3|nr:hypothetical protein SERLA73DRAFT_81095 [Serpula lacrymans var. lacrymans S7.3]
MARADRDILGLTSNGELPFEYVILRVNALLSDPNVKISTKHRKEFTSDKLDRYTAF